MPDNGALERLSKKLNAGGPEEEPHRSTLYPKGSGAPPAWHDEPKPMARVRRFSPFTLLFFGSLIFFVVAVGFAALLFFSGTNTISTKNVDVQVSGPSQIDAGSTLSLQIVVTNHNPVPIQLADLVVTFPPDTRSDQDISVAVPSTRISLGTINPGESVNQTVRAVLFGQAGSEPSIPVSVEYRTPSSNAVFTSDTTYTTQIAQSPASIVASAETQVVSGQPTTITVTITSNSSQPLTNMLLTATYPPGFSFTSSNPAPLPGNDAWSLGDIEAAGSRTVTINGTFTAEDGDVRALTFAAGNQDPNSAASITVPLANAETDVTVTKPFISAQIALNDSIADQHTIVRGQIVDGEITWTNNLPVAVQNLSITLALNGDILDPTSVRTAQGFYQSANSSIVWDKTTESDFASVAPGASGKLDFSFATLPLSQGVFQNPELDFSVAVNADRSDEGNVPESVNSTAETKALIATDLALTASLSHNGDSGPIPPKANTETDYTVSWDLSNSANGVANAAVTATLPNYARFIESGDSAVSFDPTQGVVTWNIGDISAGESPSTSFTVGITPSVSQAGQVPNVIENQQASAFDRFVQDNVSATAPNLTTASAAASQDQGLVVP